MNTFGRNFRLSLWGESHGSLLGITLDGVPAGIPLSAEEFEADLARRRSGAAGTTPRREKDTPRIVSGLYRGHTTGAPLTLLFDNTDTRSADYPAAGSRFRPSHADRTAWVKYHGYNDPRGGGHFSGRLTLPLVAAGVVAKQMLPGEVRFETRLAEMGGCDDASRFEELLRNAAAEGDSLGGVVACRVRGVPAGYGEPFFDTVEGVAAHLLFAIPGVKGVEFGSGFAAARSCGSANNDLLLDAEGHTATNHAGGIDGGITNGNDLVVRVAFKPTPSIAREQFTYDPATGTRRALHIGGRHDLCIALRGAVVVEAALAIILADLLHP